MILLTKITVPQLTSPHPASATAPSLWTAKRRLEIESIWLPRWETHQAFIDCHAGVNKRSLSICRGFCLSFLFFQKCTTSFKLWLVCIPAGSRSVRSGCRGSSAKWEGKQLQIRGKEGKCLAVTWDTPGGQALGRLQSHTQNSALQTVSTQ